MRSTAVVPLWGAVLAFVAVAMAPPALAAEDVIAAARAGDVAAVRALVADGADVDARQGDGATALHWAAHRGDHALAEVLIAAGADVDAGNAPRRHAAVAGVAERRRPAGGPAAGGGGPTRT